MTEAEPPPHTFLFHARSPLKGPVRLAGFLMAGDRNRVALLRGPFLDLGFAGTDLGKRQFSDLLARLASEAPGATRQVTADELAFCKRHHLVSKETTTLTHVTEFHLLSSASRTQPDVDVAALDDLRRALLSAASSHVGSLTAPPAPSIKPRAPVAVKLLPEFRPGLSRPVWPPSIESGMLAEPRESLGCDWQIVMQFALAPINPARRSPAPSETTWVTRLEPNARRLLGYLRAMGREDVEIVDALADGEVIFEYAQFLIEHRSVTYGTAEDTLRALAAVGDLFYLACGIEDSNPEAAAQWRLLLDEEIERLAEQLRALQRKAPKTASYDALVRKDAWVCWPTFQDRGRAFIHDGVRAAREGLLDDTEIALRVGDSAMLSLSGVHVPHMRCGQLELLVVTPNPKGLRCIHKLCSDLNCPGNTITKLPGGKILLFFAHHKTRSKTGEPMVLPLEESDPAYEVVELALRTVGALHAGAAEDKCEYTFFSSASGGRADVSGRLVDILRDSLRLGEGVSSTSLRRALVDWAMRNDAIPESEKRAMATSMGHSYDTWRKHYDKQRGSREQGIGRAAFTKYVEEEMAHPAAPSGSAQKKKTAAPPAPGAQAEAPVLVPAGAEAEAGIGAEHALQEAAAAEPPSRPASPAGPVPVPGGSLAALLEAEAEAQAQAEAEANAPKRERPSLLDALLAQGGKLRFGSGGGLRGPKPSPKANGRPAGEYAWKWLKADVAPFSEADVRQITGAKALKMLIASCIEQPDGKAEFPGSNRVPYLQAVLLAARPRPRGM